MAKTDKAEQARSPIVRITLANYDLTKQDENSKKFMSPLIDGILKRVQLAKAE